MKVVDFRKGGQQDAILGQFSKGKFDNLETL